MKRVALAAAVGALLLGVALPAMAQQPSLTVTFGGEMRVIGVVWDNITDFADTGAGGVTKDSQSRYFQRWRLFTTVQSADKKAKAVWALEVGDITWGNGGGASGAEYSGTGTRVGPSQGGGLGADGVNVETKNLYVQFDLPGIPGANLLLGAAPIVFLSSPTGGFMDDDGFKVEFNWKADPVDLQVYAVKVDENNTQDPDDVDMYVARLGVNVTKDVRFTLEGMVVNQQCIGATRPCSQTPNVDLGDNFWIGATASAKLGTVSLDGTFVYGQRQQRCPTCSAVVANQTAEQQGWGVQLTARVPVGAAQMWFHGWYTTGDDRQTANGVSNPVLTRDSDKLPIPIANASWIGAPFQAEFITGNRTIGSPGLGQPLYADPTGLYGVGASVIYALTPQLSLAGGVAYVGVSEEATVGKSAPFGDNVFELDGGLLYTYNSNLSFQFVGGYLIADQDDDAWGLAFRTRFAF
jgi:hypothetical protein